MVVHPEISDNSSSSTRNSSSTNGLISSAVVDNYSVINSIGPSYIGAEAVAADPIFRVAQLISTSMR